MDPITMAEKLKQIVALIEEVSDDLNDRSKACECCGLSVRESMYDYQAKQALDGAAGRVVRLYEKLVDGTWQGREMAPVKNASDVRRGG